MSSEAEIRPIGMECVRELSAQEAQSVSGARSGIKRTGPYLTGTPDNHDIDDSRDVEW